MLDSTTAGPVGGITVVERPDRTVARLWGEIDEALREQASTALVRALDRELPVLIETSEVQFIDSTGIAFLIQFCRIGREEGLEVTLASPPPIVSNVLTMLGLDEMFATGDGADALPEPDGADRAAVAEAARTDDTALTDGGPSPARV
jgi:anti-anti-sigma factor